VVRRCAQTDVAHASRGPGSRARTPRRASCHRDIRARLPVKAGYMFTIYHGYHSSVKMAWQYFRHMPLPLSLSPFVIYVILIMIA